VDILNIKKILAGISLVSLIGAGGTVMTGCSPTSGWSGNTDAGGSGVQKSQPAGSGWGGSKGTVGTEKPGSGWGASKGAGGTEDDKKKKKAGSGW